MGSDATPLEASLAQLADAADLLGLADVAEQVDEASRRLAGLEFEVAVVGEFKRGKSTLLNALVEAEVLPAGVLPLTAVPTRVGAWRPGLPGRLHRRAHRGARAGGGGGVRDRGA
jgi:Dynamin family